MASDKAMRESLLCASDSGSSVRFLKLAAPGAFRREVIDKGSAFNLLVTSKSSRIEFLLANPYGTPFLNRMDAEGKDNREIHRVRNQVLTFSQRLLTAGEARREGEFLVAFHSRDLLWNLSIIGEDNVVVRSYHAASTGHDDSIADVHLCGDSDSRLAESFISYYRSIRDDPDTCPITSVTDADSERIRRPPSLFKGNAVWCDDGDRPAKSICKMLLSRDAREAEANWLETRYLQAKRHRCFRPVGLVNRGLEVGKDCHGEFGLRLEAVNGVTAADLLFAIQRIAEEHEELAGKAKSVVSGIVGQALTALDEFRQVWTECGRTKLPATVYPWAVKLRDGLQETGGFVTRNVALLSDCQEQLSCLAEELDEWSVVPFRDAHLKNRLVCLEPSRIAARSKSLCRWLLELEDIGSWLLENTYDIDFETACWLVPEWDDPLHVLSSPNLGLFVAGNASTHVRPTVLPHVVEWWKKPEDPRPVWITLLCRSLRELCRRIWYSNVMPATYQRRYRIEKRRHFLDFAKGAADHVGECDAIKTFLLECERRLGSILQVTEADGSQEPVVAEHQSYVAPRLGIEQGGEHPDVAPPKGSASRSQRFTVALSFPGEHRGFASAVADELALTLGRNRVFYDKNFEAELARLNLETYLQRIYHDDSELVVVFLCADYEQKEWCQLEWRAIRDLIKRRRAADIMFLRFDLTRIEGVFSTDGYVDLRDRTPCDTARLILQRLSANRESS